MPRVKPGMTNEGTTLFNNAAIIGVGQSAYTRRPEPGQTALHFMRDRHFARASLQR